MILHLFRGINVKKRLCKCCTLKQLDLLKSTGKFHPHTAVNYILNTDKSIVDFVGEGVGVKFKLYNFHFLHNWKRLAKNLDYAKQIVKEAEKSKPSRPCKAFSAVLKICQETIAQNESI
jgi:hypothetical protein